jgi:TRAP-type uncharacterized transport system substrate-binding protein
VKRVSCVLIVFGVLWSVLGMVAAQSLPAVHRSPAPSAPVEDANGPWGLPNRDQVNAGTVTIITAPVGGATSILGSDMARVLDSDNLRVLPIIGQGPAQNVIDILYLKTIDMGAVVSDVPEFFKLQYNIPDVASRLRYIAKLYNNEIHIIAPTSIKTVFDLAGKKVMAPKNVGFYSARSIFSRLNINATFDFQTDDTRALQKVVDGEADAWIVSTGKIMPIARNLKNEDRKLHLVSIPYDPRLRDLYLPSVLTSEEYPNLLPAGQQVDTLAASVLLATFNWPENTLRYAKVAKFVEAFFANIDEFFKPPRHPKWKESSIVAAIPGWQRFKAAQQWLDQNRVGAAGAPPAASSSAVESSDDFKKFLQQSGASGRGNLTDAEVLKLYSDYLEWKRRK